MRRPALAAITLAATACSPALREPPSLASIAGTTAALSAADASAALENAAVAWSRRPDAGAVREAEAAYMQAAQTDTSGIDALIGAVRAKAWLADHESDAKRREELAVSCVQTAQWCGRRAPGSPACAYWLAIAVGLQAREIRATADDGIKTMVASLEQSIRDDPGYDHGGPERILAIVLTRAPGWPLGPGDPERAVEHATKAVALDGAYPPNVLALGEALAAIKDRPAARDAYARARSLAAAMKASGHPDASEWMVQADSALAKIKP